MSLLGIADTRLDLRARMPRLGPPTPPS
jgi:hypothetical protein